MESKYIVLYLTMLIVGVVLDSNNLITASYKESLLVGIVILLALYVSAFVTKTKLETSLEVDKLTGLPYRSSLVYQFSSLVENYTYTGRSLQVIVIIINLDKFKLINENLGTLVGDSVLLAIAGRLKTTDTHLKFYRLDGSTFGCLSQIADISEIESVSNYILDIFKDPFIVNKRNVFISTTLGMSIFPNHSTDVGELLHYAEMARVFAKREAFTGAMVYDNTVMVPETTSNFLDLQTAVVMNQFILHYQVKKDIKTGYFCGVEALVRWVHPKLGVLYPDKFISLMETSNLIMPLTMQVIHQGLVDLKKLIGLGFKGSLSINISPYCRFSEKDFSYILETLEIFQIPAETLILEITESATNFSDNTFMEMFTKFNKSGVRLSIDDFGTGRSSLLYLKNLPISELKIDKSFVISMLDNEQDYYIIKSILQLAEGLKCVSVAEGVETPEVEEALLHMGCDVIQGYYVSKPLTYIDLVHRLGI